MILITGASGYVGSHLTKRLVTEGYKVRALVRNTQYAHKERRLEGLEIEWVEGDVTKPETLVDAIANTEAIIHTVAIAIEKGKRKYEQINFQGTVNIVDAAKKAGVTRFLNMSQMGAAAHLPYRFLASKGKAQEYVATSGLDWTAFRPCVIWGPEDEFANTFAKLIPLSPLIYPTIGDEDTKFQPVWVEDVVTCFIKALKDPGTIEKEYELGGPEILTLEEIERRTLKAMGARRQMVHFPIPLLRIIVTLMETLLPNPPITRSLLELLEVSNVAEDNAIFQFVPDPRPFKVEFIASYMQNFRLKDTISQFLGR